MEKSFTIQELRRYNGKRGSLTYVAYKGRVYDVSNSTHWREGVHHPHEAGEDLTGTLKDAPHGMDLLERFPVVGKLITKVGMKCPKCLYEWIPKAKNPKRCPRCGKWLIPKPIDQSTS